VRWRSTTMTLMGVTSGAVAGIIARAPGPCLAGPPSAGGTVTPPG
jgi:hypothetical protein